MTESILRDIQNRNLRLTVLGAGYVGLPTAALFANAGFHVTAIDIRPEVIKAVNHGDSSINEPSLQELTSHNVRAGRLKAALSSAEIPNQTDAVIITVQTPIDQTKKPDLSFLLRALETTARNIRKGMLAVVGSTVPPGTMLGQVRPKLEALSGLKADIDFYLAYVPERIAPGRAIKEFVESPRLAGGVGPNSTRVAAELFRTVCKNMIETDAVTAEVAKLAENTFRDVNIAFANQLALVCEQLGADVMEVIRLANTHPRVNIHLPGPGVGGPCLPKDPYLLLYKSEPLDHDVVTVARQINDYMPRHTVSLVIKALKDAGKEINKSKITVLGTTYKGDVGDTRLSPSDPIIHELMRLGLEVTSYDPYSKESFGAKGASSLHEATRSADCLVILTDHSEFKRIDLEEVKESMNEKPAIIDGKRIVNPAEAEKIGFIYYGIGLDKQREM